MEQLRWLLGKHKNTYQRGIKRNCWRQNYEITSTAIAGLCRARGRAPNLRSRQPSESNGFHPHTFVPAHCLDPQPGRRRRIKGIWIFLTGAAHWSDQRCRTLTNASLQLFYNDILIWPRQPIIPFSATFFAWPCNCCTF